MDDAVKSWLEGAHRFALLRAEDELMLGRQVREWLDHPEGKDSASPRVQRRGLRARERMVQCNLRLVWSVTRRCAGPRDSLIDLLQCGAIGLVRGVEKFDPARGYKLSTFAYWWIRQAIGRARECDHIIHIPTHLQQKIRGGQDVKAELKSAAECAYRPRSLNAPLCTDGSTAELADSIAGPYLGTEGAEWREALEAARQVDAEAVELALEQGLTTPALSARLLKARRRLRGLAEVSAVMVAG